MAGTITVRSFVALTNLGHTSPMSSEYDVADIDEYSCGYENLADTTAVTINVGEITTVTGLAIKLVSGGTTIATGLSLDLSTDTWAATDFVLLSGESVFLRPSVSTMSVKNLDSSACVIEYTVFGEG